MMNRQHQLKPSQQATSTWRARLKAQCLDRIRDSRRSLHAANRHLVTPPQSQPAAASSFFEPEDDATVPGDAASSLQPVETPPPLAVDPRWLRTLIEEEWGKYGGAPPMTLEQALEAEEEIRRELEMVTPGPWVEVATRTPREWLTEEQEVGDWEEWEKKEMEGRVGTHMDGLSGGMEVDGMEGMESGAAA
ncbi:hypothetical protein HK101_006124 [Irineochytrium annulatum]|nr:hypothetical protein HK101_006124 [Irineochytrium annulatum]